MHFFRSLQYQYRPSFPLTLSVNVLSAGSSQDGFDVSDAIYISTSIHTTAPRCEGALFWSNPRYEWLTSILRHQHIVHACSIQLERAEISTRAKPRHVTH